MAGFVVCRFLSRTGTVVSSVLILRELNRSFFIASTTGSTNPLPSPIQSHWVERLISIPSRARMLFSSRYAAGDQRTC